MLNTIMALWNQDRDESRQRIIKVFFTILFITGSVSLFLFTLNSSTWSPFIGAQEQQTKKEEQPTVSDSRGIAITGNTPIDNSETASVTPTAKTASTKVMVHPSCVRTPAVVGAQKVTTIPQDVMAYSGKNSNLERRPGEQSHGYPKTVQIKKGKRHFGNRSNVKVITPSVSRTRKTVPVAPPVPPIATSTQPTAGPVATAQVIATTTPGDGTVVSNVPALVTISATSDISAPSATQFTSSLQQKGALQAAASSLVRHSKKSSDGKNADVHGNVECS